MESRLSPCSRLLTAGSAPRKISCSRLGWVVKATIFRLLIRVNTSGNPVWEQTETFATLNPRELS